MSRKHCIVRAAIICRDWKRAAASLTMVMLSFGFSLQARTASVTLGWDPSPAPQVVGYNVYYGPDTRRYTNFVDVGNETVGTVFGLMVGAAYHFAVTAYNSLGLESPPSDEIVYTLPSGTYRPKFQNNHFLQATNGSFNFTLGADPGTTVIIQSSTDLVHWVSISTNAMTNTTLRLSDPVATNLIRFFRAVVP